MASRTQEDSDRIEPEIRDDRTEAANIDEEEVEELHNSLKEVVHDPAVKPKFQCLMVDPSFSMVTVQSEDSGIVWETASSRCSTPWASEASSPSDSYSLEGSGTQGNIVIIMDEDKVRRRKRTSSKGKFGDRFCRPGSRFSGPAIGEERPAMAEVSVPNIRKEDSEAAQAAEGTANRDQELFNLISEGFEILNIVVPSKLPTVDEECSTELADNLSYLEHTPKIKTKSRHESLTPVTDPEVIDSDIQEVNDDSSTALSQTPANEQLKKDETDVDYLEKFTLLDQHGAEDESGQPGPTQDIQIEEPQKPEVEQKLDEAAVENSFVVISEAEIAADHLDEVFYGASCSAEPELPSHDKENEEQTSGSFKTLKECGSTLFGSQETILTPIYLPPGPPKIIDQDLLDEPRAMSFHYLDLYENALGSRKKDDDASDIESVISEKSFKRRYSDSDEGDGYLEKFILKDETTPVVVQDVQQVETAAGDRVIWPQSKFEMSGCLIRVKEDEASQEEECQTLSKDCEGCDGLQTGCMTAKCVSETLEGCDTPTGCATWKAVDKTPFKRDEVCKAELKRVDQQISAGSVEEKTTELIDKFGILPNIKKESLDKERDVRTKAQNIGKPYSDITGTSTTSTAEEMNNIIQNKVCESEKCEEVTSLPGEHIKVTEELKVSNTVQGGESDILESKKEESLKDTEVTEKTMVPAMEELELKTGLKPDISEGKCLNEADTTEAKVEESKVQARAKLKEQTEQDPVAVLDRETSATNGAASERTETKDSTVGSLKDVATCVFTLESDNRKAKGDFCLPAQKIPERDLTPTVVHEKVGREEDCELADVLKESRTEIKKISLVSSTENDALSKVAMPTPITKEKDDEIRDVTIATGKVGTVGDALQPVHPKATYEADGVFKVSEQELEGVSVSKSTNVALKDTHKEELWRSLEPASPSPPVEIQDVAMRVSPLEQEEHTKENYFSLNVNIEKDEGPFLTLRSFSPLEDLSGFGRDLGESDLQKEIYEELDYEMVTEQDARQPETGVSVAKEDDQDHSRDQSQEPPIEADYEFIEDVGSIQTPKLEETEIQPMDAFCLSCQCPMLTSDGGHENHEVSTLEKAFEDIKNQLSIWISALQEKSENIEDLVSELELAYNSVEEQCKDDEKALDERNEEMMRLVMEQYNEMSQAMEEEKKAKLEQLYDQIVSFQENTDSAKEAMEATTKEMEEADDLAFLTSYQDVDERLKTALDSVMSLELGPRGLLVFEDYAKGTTGNGKKNRQVIPVPQQPHLQPQEANSATSTSLTVYWTVNEGDIIDCFQVYCMEEPQGAISEEYRVTVKESYCNLEELEADKCYKVWVMAVNYTGCSLPSERLPFRTAPSVPVINPEACTVLWESATIRWSSSQPSSAESFTLEYCRQYALEGEGLRSVSGIRGGEHKVLLQPNENFLFYIKSVNSAGASEQSEAALISTRGTRFHLLSETANMALKVSEDKNTVRYPVEAYNKMSTLVDVTFSLHWN